MKVYPKYLVPLTILVSALGYFVDIYDILLFSIVRQSSLATLGVAPEESLAVGLSILNWQVGGLILGGILWGAIGDKKGRLSVLFFSILLYSVANFLNGYIVTVEQYQWCRFIAGIGLAGELGAGITIVSSQKLAIWYKYPCDSYHYSSQLYSWSPDSNDFFIPTF